MRYWIREVAGWLLVVMGLYIFRQCYVLLTEHAFLEGSTLSVVGIIVFRGGIHLLKIAVAAQVCVQAQADALRQQAPPTSAATARGPSRLPVSGRRFS
jgi:hypothetical protein